MKVALVYDRVNKWGGAERVLLALKKIFPNAPLFTSVYNEKKAPWAKNFEVKSSFLQSFPGASSLHEFYVGLMPSAFESFSFDDYDVVISVTSEAAKGIITKPKTLHVCYCLTPTRYLWSGYDDYFKSPWFKTLTKPVVSYLRHWDKHASHRPDEYIAISNEVKQRIKKYYDKDSIVIYPPLTFGSSISSKGDKNKGKFFLIVSRLVPYKRIDVAINACNDLKLPLKIVGTGLEEANLRKIAGPTIEFLGQLTDEKLSYYYNNCKALIFPGVEDFGLVMVEAQMFGKPVIAFRGGGALETIIEGVTGEFFNKQDPFSLKEILVKFNDKSYNDVLCRENASRFSFEKFEKDFKKYLEGKIKNI